MEKQNSKFALEFAKNYKKLNSEQKNAVDAIDGPVMVIAGPGTGKTHILAMRIGNIRLKTDAHASNILCLTFTEAGATAMRKRLLSLIGPEAHKVHIFTFHGFCNNVIQNNSDIFGGAEYESLSDLEQIEIIRTLIDQLPSSALLKKIHDPYFYLNHLKQLFKVIKTENWISEKAILLLDRYSDELGKNPEFQFKTGKSKGLPNQKAIEEERNKIAILKEAILLYPVYQKALKDKKRYDYDDMILWVIEAFQKNDFLLSRYQEQYLYFLVDEYQDTNGAQNAVLMQLISYWDVPNVFIVGDDDQAIYEFQGARLQSLKELRNKYQEHIQIVILKENYRSTQQILNASMALIEKNQIRIINQLKEFGFDKHLKAANKQLKKSYKKPVVASYANTMQEYSDIADQIEGLIKAGVQANEIAVIYAQNKQALLMMDLLDKKGIPYSTKKPVNILNERLIRQIIDVLKYIDAETNIPGSGESLIFEILHFPYWKIKSANLATLALELRKYDSDSTTKKSWRRAIGNSVFLASCRISDQEKIENASAVLEYLMDNKSTYSAVKFFEIVISKTGILAAALESEAIINDLQLLHTFLAFIDSETRRNGDLTVTGLLNTIAIMEKHNIGIPLNKTISADKGALLTTAHSAKGLEFDYVFMVDCSEEKWNKKTNSRGQFKLPAALTLSSEETNDEEAQRRLFYVAMTRAKHSLQISYSEDNRKNRVKFIDELLEDPGVEFSYKEQNTESAIATHTLLLKEVASSGETINNDFVKEKLLDFKLSPSGLNRYIECPLGFYYEHILGIPQAHSEHLSFGIAMHAALEKAAREQKRSGQLPELSFLISHFHKEMEAAEYLFGKERFKQFSDIGENDLSFFYANEMISWKANAEVELSFSQGTIDGVPISGKIDRIEYLTDGSVNIIDFKTGVFKKENTKALSEKNSIGGIYRRQLIFYRLLFEQHINGSKPVKSVQLIYTKPGPDGQLQKVNEEIPENEKELFRNLLKTTYDKIMNLEFKSGCGKKDCKWCNFVKNNISPSEFENPEIDGLDDN